MIFKKPNYKVQPKAWQHLPFLALTILLLLCCKKQNVDYTYDYRSNTGASKESNVRLINMSVNKQLLVNGKPLTNFFLPKEGSGLIPVEETVNPGTKYFPKDGLLGLIWKMPQDLFLADGTAQIKTSQLSNRPELTNEQEFVAKENNNQPKDYYLLISHPAFVQDGKSTVEVPRDVTAPTRPDHFKIRVLNLSLMLQATNPLENIFSSYTLTYADGTPLNKATSAVQPGAWSEYIEVPYGTYQFKLMTSDGRQVPASGQNTYGYIHTATSTIEGTTVTPASTGLTYAPILTYQPGGVYTIVVHPTKFTWRSGIDDIHNLQNSFQVIPDVTEPQNTGYSRVQLANALPESVLQMRVQSKSTTATAYSNASSYQNVVSGKQTIEIIAKDGKVIAKPAIDLLPGSNYTLWVHPDANNTAKTVLVSNNKSGIWYIGDHNDASNSTMDRRKSEYFFNLRFLNLCPEIPYATFTDGGGIPFGKNLQKSSGINLEPGIPVLDDPYSRLLYDGLPAENSLTNGRNTGDSYKLMVYASSPNRVPGDWIPQVLPALSTDYLVANKALYTNANRRVPAHEPGLYTVALVGHYKANSPSSTVKLMIVKHTK